MAHHEITFPTDEATIRELHAGDTVTIQGHIMGIRDATQIRIFDHGQEPPMSLEGAALLHTAPNVRKLGEGRYEPMCIGTTTSARMSRFTEGLIRDYGARAIIGKGGLLPEALTPMREQGGVYFAIVGGAAALETELFQLLNETGVGPMGLGGDTTVLSVHVEQAHTHITLNPVAVNYQCWAARRASVHIAADGSIEYDREA